MSPTATELEFKTARRSKAVTRLLAGIFCSIQFLCFHPADSCAAITATGDVSPASPASWTSNTYAYIGKTSTGTISVTLGSDLLSDYAYLGYDAGSSGTATVTNTGSTWTGRSAISVGYSGSGALNIEAGGQVIINVASPNYVGQNAGSVGIATVTGNGSTWTTNNFMGIGYDGSGTVNVLAGGQFTTLLCYIGAHLGSSGAANISGVGSRWTNNGDLLVGYLGGGKITVADGGVVTTTTLLASSNALFGNGTISVNGLVRDDDLAFDTTHGLQRTFSFGTGGILNLNINGSGGLGAGYEAVGTLRIADGITVATSYGSLGYKQGSQGTATVTGTGTTWTNTGGFDIGLSGSAALNVEAGGQVTNSRYCYIGYGSGSRGTATITGAGSKWTISSGLYVGRSGDGTLRIEAGGQVSDTFCTLGYDPGTTGTVTVTGPGSIWANSGELKVGFLGTATLTVADGGVVTATTLYASSSALFGNGTISVNGLTLDDDLVFDGSHGLQQTFAFGSGGVLNLSANGSGSLGIGYDSTGTLKITDGIAVAFYGSYLAYKSGSVGTATVTGAGSKWTNSKDLHVGSKGNGTLNIAAGGEVSDASGIIGYYAGSTSTATITGIGSKWTNSGSMYVGYMGNGTLNIEAGGQVSNATGYVGNSSGSTCVAKVSGSGSQWLSTGDLYVRGGMLNIEGGGQVSNANSYLDNIPAATAVISGAGSKWTNTGSLYVGQYVSGALTIEAGGQVSAAQSYLGYNGGNGTATITGIGSKWTTGLLDIWAATLNIEMGAQVNSTDSEVRYSSTATVSGSGTQWNNSHNLVVSGGIVNLGSDALVTAKLLFAANQSGAGNFNINGGTLQAGAISNYFGKLNFNWNDGTIRNYDANTDLTAANIYIFKLAASGKHTFNIDLNRTGTIDAVLTDSTSGGSLRKIGAGSLVLTAVNTYSGATIVDEGRFKVTGSILNTSGITVGQAGILELAKTSGSATAAIVGIDNAGTVLVSAGAQTVGAISGTGVTQVAGTASLTAASITQNTLSIGSGAADAAAIGQVPEPASIVLLTIGAIGLLAVAWRRSRHRL